MAYFLKRCLLLFPVLFLVVTLVFFMLRLIPGDPVDFILGENAQQADRAMLLKNSGLDLPLKEQYIRYWKNIANGQLGLSYENQKPVVDLIVARYPNTVRLAVASLLWAAILAFPLGMLTAVRKGKILDRAGLVVSLAGISAPTFYLGPLLVWAFSIKMDWFPVSGVEMPGSFVLPSLTLGAALAALLMRVIRSSFLDVLRADYIRTAKAKGVNFVLVLFKHALRNALLPIIAVLGLQLGALLTGAIVTEKIFSIPGLGSLMLEAIQKRDYAVVQGTLMVIAVSYVLVNLVTDLTYGLVDPRIKLGKS